MALQNGSDEEPFDSLFDISSPNGLSVLNEGEMCGK